MVPWWWLSHFAAMLAAVRRCGDTGHAPQLCRSSRQDPRTRALTAATRSATQPGSRTIQAGRNCRRPVIHYTWAAARLDIRTRLWVAHNTPPPYLCSARTRTAAPQSRSHLPTHTWCWRVPTGHCKAGWERLCHGATMQSVSSAADNHASVVCEHRQARVRLRTCQRPVDRGWCATASPAMSG